MGTALLRFNRAVQRDPGIDQWINPGQPSECAAL